MSIKNKREADFNILQKPNKIPLLLDNLYRLSIIILHHFVCKSNFTIECW